MNSNKKEKKFDCLKMKEELQAIVYEKIKDMSSEEMLAFFSKPTGLEPFATLRKRAEQQKATT